MKQICRNCHFLAKEIREDNTGRFLSFSVSASERKKAENGNIGFIPDHYSLKCHHGVWDEGVSPVKENRLIIVTETKRKKKCFFWPYNPALLFKAAEELQKRDYENEQLKRSNLYTRIGLWIAAIGLVFGAFVSLLKD